MTKEEYTKERPLRVVTMCSGYDSQYMALERLKSNFPGFDYDCIAWAEIDRYAIQAHDAVFPQYRDRNMGDITSCDWYKITQPVDLLIYSTPCTSISNAGKQEGLKKGSGTASSIIWSVLNAIDVLKPKYLLMENVKALVSKKFMPDFREWYNELASRGYQNFWKVLNAKDYCVPQNRERVFMVSILDGDASFHFPEPFPLERRLKDILEEDVDERYYLSDKCVKGFMEHNRRHQEKGTGILCRPKSGEDIGNAVRANGAICPTDNVIMEPVIAASQGRNPQNPSDRTAGCPTEQRLEIGGDISNTVTTVEKDCLVVMPICLNPKVDGKQPSLEHRVYDCGGISTAVTTGFMPSIAEPCAPTPKILQRPRGNNKGGEKELCPTISSNSFEYNNMLKEGFQIRKLTPRECFRLMDVSEEDIDRIQKAGISRSQQYKMAGNSIVVACLYHIFRKLFIEQESESQQLTIF